MPPNETPLLRPIRAACPRPAPDSTFPCSSAPLQKKLARHEDMPNASFECSQYFFVPPHRWRAAAAQLPNPWPNFRASTLPQHARLLLVALPPIATAALKPASV